MGTDNGYLACICITEVVELANKLKKAVMQQRNQTNESTCPGADGFDCTDMDIEPMWIVERAHQGSVEQVVFCTNRPPVLLSLGIDLCIRLWAYDTGEALGTLEQGPPEGLSAEEQRAKWRYPIHAHAQAVEDCNALVAVTKSESAEEDSKPTPNAPKRLAVIEIHSLAGESVRPTVCESRTGKAREKGKHSRRSSSEPNLQAEKIKALSNSLRVQTSPSVGTGKALMMPRYMFNKKECAFEDWLSGPLGSMQGVNANHPLILSSGLRRPNSSSTSDVVQAARKLSQALGNSLANSGF